MNDVSIEEIKGRKVLDKAGNAVGNVEDVTFTPEGLKVTTFIVKVNREAADRMRLDQPMLGSARIQVGAERLGSIGDSILLNIDQTEMARMLYEERRP